ncbi:transporter [Erysipelatoclostridium sp. An15]|uniref:AEC family transporter n=1 Tax=Erysipelatoclostridium sp. An15 TaxID=1965566 RepID=UPI000B38FA76|nr:AEC family transporter [Erysipelatoclostridium sp. An15]OUQ07546.1 transporter [Erysipelatoclostridium sp. An15]
MAALTTLFPVFFMIGLGAIARIKNWITPEQKDGANNIVFNVLFPIMIFNVLFTAKIEVSVIWVIIYVFIAFVLTMVIGKLISGFTGKELAHISPYLLTTCEGGNVALPLYTSIVGLSYASNTVIFDIAGSFIAFVVIPILVAKSTAGKTNNKDLLKTIFTNSFVIAVTLALILNLSGFYNYLSQTPFINVYTSTVTQATAPIVGMILFIIGYNLKIKKETLPSLLKLLSVRLVLYVCIIAGFFIFFPHMMADKIYMIAVLIYFMSPTGFAVPMLISPLNKSEEDADFQSAFISLFMVITLIVYTVIVIFIY